MNYLAPVYRPPSEANSLILQITYGCSHNRCTFCGMYKEKAFKIRAVHDVKNDIQSASTLYNRVQRIFLADGDALIMPFEALLDILKTIRASFPHCERISAYASPASLKSKSLEELTLLHQNGLHLLYVGIESGSDRILSQINKGYSKTEMIALLTKAQKAGYKLSTMLISGLGGKAHFKEHAIMSAEIINQVQPDYISLLTLMLEPNTELYFDYQQGKFELLSPIEVLEETKLFLSHLTVTKGTFRSNHASNYLNLAGELPRDIPKLIGTLESYLQQGGQVKPEYMRGL